MKFSIRDLLLLMAIVALTLGWWVDRRQRPQELLDAKKWRTRVGGEEVFRDLNWKIEWEPESVRLTQETRTIVIDTNAFEPSPIPLSSALAQNPSQE